MDFGQSDVTMCFHKKNVKKSLRSQCCQLYQFELLECQFFQKGFNFQNIILNLKSNLPIWPQNNQSWQHLFFYKGCWGQRIWTSTCQCWRRQSNLDFRLQKKSKGHDWWSRTIKRHFQSYQTYFAKGIQRLQPC